MQNLNAVLPTLESDSWAGLADVFGDSGYSSDFCLSDVELTAIRELMRDQWLERISQLSPEELPHFQDISPHDYHEFSHLLPHDDLWTYKHRHFSENAVARIKSFGIFDIFREAFPNFRFTGRNPPHEDLGRTRMVWRIVRPGAGRDVGPCHADYWFDAAQTFSTDYPVDAVPVKLWIPLWNDPGETGLSVVYGSHQRAWEFGGEVRDGVVKPTFVPDAEMREEVLVDVAPGSMLVFSDRLLHRGVNSNNATRTRVSVEIVMLVPKTDILNRFPNAIGLDIWGPQ